MDLLCRLAALLAVAILLCVTGCDRGSRGTGDPDGPVRVAAASDVPDRAAPRFAPGKLEEHFAKHGGEMGFADQGAYLRAAQALVMGGPGVEILQRGGDTLYFKEATGEFAVVSNRNVLRTYFKPGDGRRYWERQKQR